MTSLSTLPKRLFEFHRPSVRPNITKTHLQIALPPKYRGRPW